MNANKGLIGGSVLALTSSAIGLTVAFGAHVNTTQRDAIISFATAVIAVAPSIGALFDHSHRQANARVEAAQQPHKVVQYEQYPSKPTQQ